eukprot:SAG31_NODE_9389_length_1285_cov_1.716695_1_plen_153_part_00
MAFRFDGIRTIAQSVGFFSRASVSPPLSPGFAQAAKRSATGEREALTVRNARQPHIRAELGAGEHDHVRDAERSGHVEEVRDLVALALVEPACGKRLHDAAKVAHLRVEQVLAAAIRARGATGCIAFQQMPNTEWQVKWLSPARSNERQSGI